MQRLAFAGLIGSVCLSCTTVSAPRTADDAAGLIRTRIAEAPDDIRRGILLDELAKVELQRARQANTVLAYRHFLEEFPHGEEASTARVLLEELRFQEASSVNTREGWEAFLDEHPRGKHALEARDHLGAIEIAAALTSGDLVVIRKTLARFPEHPKREELLVREDALSWEGASKGTMEEVETYLSEHPNGAHRIKARERWEELEQKEILESEDLARARARAAAGDSNERRQVTVTTLELSSALATLDLAAVKRIAELDVSTPGLVALKNRAKAFADSWRSRPPSAALQKAIEKARPGAGLRSREALAKVMRHGDPVLQVAALRELAEWTDRADLATFLQATSSPYASVRLAAIDALRDMATSLKPSVWKALVSQRSVDVSPLRLAVLLDVSGQTREAVDAWREYLKNSSDDLVARARLFELERASGDRLAFGVAARELAKTAVSFAEERLPQVGESGRPDTPPKGAGSLVGFSSELAATRQICTAVSLASAASSALGELAANSKLVERDQLQLARTDTEKAISRLKTRQLELEQDLVRRGLKFPSCTADLAAPVIDASRAGRLSAIREVGQSGDSRLLPFVEAVQSTPAEALRAAARNAAQLLSRVTQTQ